MTEAEKNERIKAVEEQMAKLQKELEDIRNTKAQEWDFSAWGKFPLRKTYELDIPLDIFISAPFADKFNALKKLMRFKFCYDYKYMPDWCNESELKWYVYSHTPTGKYKIERTVAHENPSTVYFSSEEIAQKCADWLNAGCPEE